MEIGVACVVEGHGELERAVRLAALNAGDPGAILVVLDADDDCPKERGPELLSRAAGSVPHRPVAVVLPKREFESWYIAAAESLRGVRGLAADLTAPAAPEAIRGAKEWLSDRVTTGRGYRPTVDQAALAAHFDLGAAQARSPSFGKLCRDLRRLLSALARPCC